MTKEELISSSQKDDLEALEELLKREQDNVYATFHYLEPQKENSLDMTQEALLKLSRNIKTLKNPKSFKPWLNQIISNVFYDSLRKKSRRLSTVTLDEINPDSENFTTKEVVDSKIKPAEKVLNSELNDMIQGSIQRLPSQFKLAIILREFQGLSYEEIAEITQTSIGTTKSRIARARTKLQEYLKPYLT